MKALKKSIAGLAAAGMLFTATGCGGNDTSSDNGGSDTSDVNEITAWAWDMEFNIAALELAKEFYDGDTKVTIQESDQDGIVQRLNTMLSSGSTNGLPNIVLIEDYRAQSFLQAFPDMFYDLSDYINPDDFAPYKIEATSLDGRQYGVPFDTGVTGTFIRTDLLEEAGFSIEDVTDVDWDELIDIAIEIKDATGKNFVTLDPNDLGIIRSMIQSAGSWYTAEDGETPDLENNEALKAAFRVYERLMNEGLVAPQSSWSEFISTVNNGDVVAVPTGVWFNPSIRAEESQSGDWAVVPWPTLPGVESVGASNLGGSSWYVLNIDGKEAAAEFLASTFGSNVDFYQALIEEVGALGTFIPAKDGEAYQIADEFFGGQQIFNDFATWTSKIPEVNYGMHTYEIEDILVVAMHNFLNGTDLEQVLADAQSQAEAQLQ